MATQKRFLIVLDGDAVMGPYWPTIVSEYIQKIVRHLCGNSRSGQGVNTAVCEVGLVMYNANSESGCDMQFIQWTSDVDQFLNKLKYLAFNGNGFNASAMAEGLAEALLMFPKPSTGTPTREYYNGEKHCILVAASDPFTGKVTMVLPKIREGEFACTDVEICRVDYRHVVRMFTPLAISLSVISPKKLPIWREIFNLGNNILEITGTNPVTDSSGWFTVFLPENLKEACVEPEETTTNVTFPAYSFISNDSEDLFQITRQMNIPQQINGDAITELQSLTSLESQPVVTQNQNATDPTQIASSSRALPPMNAYEYDFNDMISELHADSDFVFPWNKPSSCITLEEDNLSELLNPTPFMSPFDDMGNSLDLQQSNSNGKQVSTDSFWDQNELEQALLPFYKPKGQSSTAASTSNNAFEQALLDNPFYIPNAQTSTTASTSNAFEQALFGSSTPPNISGAQTFIPASTDNSSKEAVNSSLLVEPQAPSNNIWSSMVQNLGDNNSFLNVQNPTNNSWTSAASSWLPSSSLHTGHQANHVGAQSTSDIMNSISNAIFQGNNAGRAQAQVIPTRGVFSLADAMDYTSGGIMNTDAILQGSGAQNSSNPVGGVFGNYIFPHAMTNPYIQPSSSSRNQIAPFNFGSPPASISELLEQNFPGHKRDLTSAFGSIYSPAATANAIYLSAVLPSRIHPPLVLPLVPMELQPDYVPTWQGAISGILMSATICYNEVRAYRKASARETLTVQWPRWLQINRTVRQSIVNNSLRVYRGPVDYVVLEILASNNNELHDCLRNRDFCAKLVLPSQTLLLTPTIEPHRFIGTILQGRHDFTALQFTHASRSRAAKALRFM